MSTVNLTTVSTHSTVTEGGQSFFFPQPDSLTILYIDSLTTEISVLYPL